MDPNALAGLLGGGIVVTTLGLIWGLVVWARSTRSGEVDALEAVVDDLRKTLESERRHARIRAAGAAADMQRALALATAAAGGDLDGVLQQFPDKDDGTTPAGEPSDSADGEDGAGTDV